MTVDLMQQHYFDELERAQTSTELDAAAQNALNRAAGIRSEFDEQAAAISRDADLSPDGKKSRLAQLSKTSGENAHLAFDDLLTKAAKQIADAELLLSQRQTTDMNPVVAEMRAKEIRERLLERTELEIIVELQNAARLGNVEFINAVADAPMPIIGDPAMVRDAQRVANLAASPGSAQQLESLQRLDSTLRGALNTLLGHVGYLGDDPLMQIAAGEAAAA